jgi:hypothetical protein
MSPTIETTKISARILAPMMVNLEKQLSQAFLKRDAFLDHVLFTEVDHIRRDLEGKKMSFKANRHIANRLNRMDKRDLRPMSIKVRKSTAEALRSVVDDHNLVRDALINRVLMLLRASDRVLKYLELPPYVNSRNIKGVEDMPCGPLRIITETMWDPFYYMRAACEETHECGLYDLPLPKELWGFSCYLSDEDVPNTGAYKRKAMLDDAEMKMWESLGAAEGDSHA